MHDAGIVDEQAAGAESAFAGGEDALDIFGNGDIALGCVNAPPSAAKRLGDRVGGVAGDVVDKEGGSFRRESRGDRSADAAARARDDGDVLSERFHRMSSWIASCFARRTLKLIKIP